MLQKILQYQAQAQTLLKSRRSSRNPCRGHHKSPARSADVVAVGMRINNDDVDDIPVAAAVRVAVVRHATNDDDVAHAHVVHVAAA